MIKKWRKNKIFPNQHTSFYKMFKSLYKNSMINVKIHIKEKCSNWNNNKFQIITKKLIVKMVKFLQIKTLIIINSTSLKYKKYGKTLRKNKEKKQNLKLRRKQQKQLAQVNQINQMKIQVVNMKQKLKNTI